jgi:hypothetical protein
MVTDATPHHRVAELYFVQGVLSYCKAEAILAGHLKDEVRLIYSLHTHMSLFIDINARTEFVFSPSVKLFQTQTKTTES